MEKQNKSHRYALCEELFQSYFDKSVDLRRRLIKDELMFSFAFFCNL